MAYDRFLWTMPILQSTFDDGVYECTVNDLIRTVLLNFRIRSVRTEKLLMENVKN